MTFDRTPPPSRRPANLIHPLPASPLLFMATRGKGWQPWPHSPAPAKFGSAIREGGNHGSGSVGFVGGWCGFGSLRFCLVLGVDLHFPFSLILSCFSSLLSLGFIFLSFLSCVLFVQLFCLSSFLFFPFHCFLFCLSFFPFFADAFFHPFPFFLPTFFFLSVAFLFLSFLSCLLFPQFFTFHFFLFFPSLFFLFSAFFLFPSFSPDVFFHPFPFSLPSVFLFSCVLCFIRFAFDVVGSPLFLLHIIFPFCLSLFSCCFPFVGFSLNSFSLYKHFSLPQTLSSLAPVTCLVSSLT